VFQSRDVFQSPFFLTFVIRDDGRTRYEQTRTREILTYLVSSRVRTHEQMHFIVFLVKRYEMFWILVFYYETVQPTSWYGTVQFSTSVVKLSILLDFQHV
jgi:hypothetical protein